MAELMRHRERDGGACEEEVIFSALRILRARFRQRDVFASPDSVKNSLSLQTQGLHHEVFGLRLAAPADRLPRAMRARCRWREGECFEADQRGTRPRETRELVLETRGGVTPLGGTRSSCTSMPKPDAIWQRIVKVGFAWPDSMRLM